MITVYTTTTCAYCQMVKKFLTMKGKEFISVNLDEEPERQKEALDLAGRMTVPITVTDKGVAIGWSPAKLMEIL